MMFALAVIIALVMLMSIVHSWIWFSVKDAKRFAVSGIFLAVAVFGITRLQQLLADLTTDTRSQSASYEPLTVVGLSWVLLLICNVVMAVSIMREKLKVSSNG